MNLRLKLSCLCSNRWIFLLQPFPHRRRILFVRSAHRLLRGQTPGSQIASHRPHRNLHSELSRQQLLHRFSGPQRKRQAQLVRATTENVAHRRGCWMRCQPRNRRSSSPLCLQRPSSFPFHHPHPAAHCTASYPEDSSRLSLRKTFLNCRYDSPAKIFLSLRRQRASILVSHARHTITLFSKCHLYYAPISIRLIANLPFCRRFLRPPSTEALPFTGVTRLHQYCEPLRHPIRPGLSLASCQLIHTAITAGISRVA